MTQATRNLWIYSLANAVSRFGNQFMFLAVTSYTYMLTNSVLATAVQMIATGLPHVLLARWSGRLADRYDPRKVIMGVSLVQAVLTLGYLLAGTTATILLLNFLVSSASVFLPPARATLLPRMVGKENLLKANARMASIGGAVQLVAPGLAGFLLVRIGASWAFLINSVSFLVPAAAMLVVRLVEQVKRSDEEEGARKPEFGLGETWAFVRERPGLLLLLGAYGAYSVGMWSVNTIFYPYATDVLRGNAEVVGWSISAYFGAASVTGMLMERWGSTMRNPRLLYGGYLVGAAIWVGYAATTSIPVAIVLSAFDGLIFTYAVTLFETRIQEEAPEHARGRVFALVRAYDETVMMSGQLMGGVLATNTGIVTSIWGSAALSAILIAGMIAAGRLRTRTRVPNSLR